MVHLKRFGLNFETFTKHKINSACEFPETLNLWEYTDSYLNGSNSNTSSDSVLTQEDCVYQLQGVLIHSGTADYGHYFSLIRERTGKQRWLIFNDESVREFDKSQIEEYCFGTCVAAILQSELSVSMLSFARCSFFCEMMG